MKDPKKELLENLSNAIINGNSEEARKIVNEAVKDSINPLKVMEEGLNKGLRIVGDKFESFEVFLPDLMMAAEAFKSGFEVIKPALVSRGKEMKALGSVVIGTVAGDIHDIGKNIVKIFLEIEGFEVYDAGADVPVDKFIEIIKRIRPDILGLSALLTSTLPNQREVIKALEKAGLRNQVKVMVGGAPVTQSWADEIGADAYAANGIDATKVARRLVGRDGV